MGVHADARELSGKWLRWVVCLLLTDARTPMTVADIVTALEAAGYSVTGRPGKTVSDALRWEVRRGRVTQSTRGSYAAGLLQRSTEYSMRQRVASMSAVSLVARTAARTANGTLPTATGPSQPGPTGNPAPGKYGPGPIDLDALDTSDEWSGPAPAVCVDDFDDVDDAD